MSLLIDIVKNAKGKSIEKVSVDLHSARVSICNKCPKLLMTGNCSVCGCFVKDKAKYLNEECPLKKW